MTLPIPTTLTIAQRLAVTMLQQQFVAADGTTVRLDPNAPHTLENVLVVVWSLALSEAYSVMRDQMLELMVTTATENGLSPDHGEMWGVPRKPASQAVGNVLVSDGTVQWVVTTATAIPSGETVAVPVQANTAGVVGNVVAGASLTLVSPVAGVTTIIVDGQGIAGGAAIEDVEIWRTRIAILSVSSIKFNCAS
ncbi:baseplate J/gp47 family protein [Acetobacter orientalis]|uniref:baseplate J/gp47 family protein n=1 Tax=Acetobacter orientalis TaxID=146474 RepID=UPI0020A18C50|nr:baseplate J/gp47 family protein [Acetobacter orientalis]MCP1217120.1 baseplate J/gp47 family protein [Acetobacter orientalis]MCP1220027.1 baseplate J/gp47 family protein [Acetobacter orientalis]